MLVARRFLVSGRVQGVGFRFFVRESASFERISGYARNLADGRVEVFAEGERDAVLRFERHVRRGPAGARVDEVDVIEETPSGRVTDFIVR
jgi:acylphosphatase